MGKPEHKEQLGNPSRKLEGGKGGHYKKVVQEIG
jgi:hypothetical protein